MKKLIALKSHKYGTRHLVAGDSYEAKARDADLLVRIKRSRYAGDDDSKAAKVKTAPKIATPKVSTPKTEQPSEPVTVQGDNVQTAVVAEDPHAVPAHTTNLFAPAEELAEGKAQFNEARVGKPKKAAKAASTESGKK